MKTTANEINRNLLLFLKGGYDVLIPNFFYGLHECDVFRITQSDFIIEYEIKISRADFFNDFKKGSEGKKHNNLSAGTGSHVPNRFFFVVPENLVSINEVPEYAGLIYYKNEWFNTKKTAKLIHKNKFTDYRSICHTLASRDEEHRIKIKKIRNTDFDKEIAAMKREVEKLKKANRETGNELWALKMNRQKVII